MKLLTLLILALGISGCSNYRGQCFHPVTGPFSYDSRSARMYSNGILILHMDDGSKLTLTGAACVISPVKEESNK